VIAVGATRFDMNKTFYSNYGIGQGGHIVDMVAPGGDVFVDQNSDGLADGVLQQTLGSSCPVTPPPPAFVYCTYMGTSMATPHVAGVAALVLEVNPALTPGEVRNILANSAEDLGPSGCDVGFGYGLVDAAGAVAAAQDSVSNPVPAPSTTCDAGADYDEDGCKDIKEFGQNPVEGGARDATDFWDFFDTPGTGAGRDKAVNSVDIFSVVQRFGSSGTGTTIADALMSPPPAPAYHAGYDRSAVAGSFSGPADGAINSADIFVLVGQFGHACG
jgi:subtilisin family serine protease